MHAYWSAPPTRPALAQRHRTHHSMVTRAFTPLAVEQFPHLRLHPLRLTPL